MYKVLIVDDELLVRIGLKSTLDWEKHGFSVVAEAANGEQAFGLYQLHRPHIVITDIKMPKKDGLWLTKAIRKEDSRTKILMLTCYGDFNTAREALKSGADDYILKSEVEDEELIHALNELKKNLDEQQGDQPEAAQPHRMRREQEDFVDAVADGTFARPDAPLQSESAAALSGAHLAFVAILRCRSSNKSGEAEDLKIDEAIANLAINAYEQQGIGCLRAKKQDMTLLLTHQPDMRQEEVDAIADNLCRTVQQYFTVDVNIATSGVFEQLAMGPQAFAQIERKIERFFYGPASVRDTGLPDWTSAELFTHEKNTKKQLLAYMDEEDAALASACLYDSVGFLLSRHVRPTAAKLFFANIVSAVFERYNHCLSGFDYAQLHDKILDSSNLQQVVGVVIDFVQQTIRLNSDYCKTNSMQIVNRIIRYIESNLSHRIYLEDLAKHSNMSKNYVCYLFKKETGVNISHYANNLRIERAKKLIAESEITVRDLCDQLGFSDQQYFSKTFKKLVGMTVTQYRAKRNGKNAEHEGVGQS